MPTQARVRIERTGGIALVWIENPPRNLLRLSMIADLAARVPELEKDDAIGAVIVAGGGGGPFSFGIDMTEWAKLSPRDAQEWMTRGQDALWALEHLTKPSVAAIVGAARGAGAEIALACDIRIADETAIFSFPEVDLGWMPSHGGTARLSKIVGRSRAMEILLTGKEVKALDALRLGIVSHLAPPGRVVEEATDLADVFSRKPRTSAKAVKRTLTEGDEKPYRNRFLLESQHAVQLLGTEAYKVAMEKLRTRKD